MRKHSIDALWQPVSPTEGEFGSAQISGLPETARRYLKHAIAREARTSSAVRLHMRGEIKLRRWFPFTADQVICGKSHMIWNATVWMHGMPVRGFDRLVDGEGAMEWKLLGIVPFIRASGADVTRSAVGRVQAESVWLPSVFLGNGISWAQPDSSHALACITVQDLASELALEVDGDGRLKTLKLSRWGNPGGGKFRYVDFGGIVEEEKTFSGYTIPARLRIGWYFGTDRFEPDGEFFRCTIDRAEYR